MGVVYHQFEGLPLDYGGHPAPDRLQPARKRGNFPQWNTGQSLHGKKRGEQVPRVERARQPVPDINRIVFRCDERVVPVAQRVAFKGPQGKVRVLALDAETQRPPLGRSGEIAGAFVVGVDNPEGRGAFG